MEYMYIPTGIKRELARSGVDCDWKGISRRDCWRRTAGQYENMRMDRVGIWLGKNSTLSKKINK